jgi:hypothetical protein
VASIGKALTGLPTHSLESSGFMLVRSTRRLCTWAVFFDKKERRRTDTDEVWGVDDLEGLWEGEEKSWMP